MVIFHKRFNMSSKASSSPTAFGFFFIIFGAAFALVAGGMLIKQEVFKKNAIQTTGTVVENVKEAGSSGYKTKYTYFDESGKVYIKTGSSTSNPPEYELGTKIKVYYSKDNPEESIYDSSTVKFLVTVFLILGLVSLSTGTVLYILTKKNIIKWVRVD